MAKYWRGHYLSCPPNKLLGDMIICPLSLRFRRLCLGLPFPVMQKVPPLYKPRPTWEFPQGKKTHVKCIPDAMHNLMMGHKNK